MKVDKTIYEMLVENTGKNILDSGGAEDRHHQRNAKKTIEQFRNEPVERFEKIGKRIERTLSVFHYLTRFGLSLDKVANKFNSINKNATNWDADTELYGVSKEAWDYLSQRGDVVLGRTFNTYNGDSDLSQVLQGTYIGLNGSEYLILQIHGGADVRGGYTNARMFAYDMNNCECLPEHKSTDEIEEDIASGEIDTATIKNYGI